MNSRATSLAATLLILSSVCTAVASAATSDSSSSRLHRNRLDQHRTQQAQQQHATQTHRNLENSPMLQQIIDNRMADSNGERSSTTSTRYPYRVSLLANGLFQTCSGSLITKFAILTSASCATKFDTIVVGDASSRDEAFTSYDTAIHPNYNAATKDNDYMILLLPNSITNEDVTYIELNRYDVIPHKLTILGWEDSTSKSIFETSLAYVTNEQCVQYSGFYPSVEDRNVWVQTSYQNKIWRSMLCATVMEEEGVTSTAGMRTSSTSISRSNGCIANNVGGPLVIKGSNHVGRLPHDVLFGSVSWGQCNPHGFPGIYSRTSNAIGWIDNVVCSSNLVLQGEGGTSNTVPASFSCSAAILRANKRAQTLQQSSNSRSEWPHFLTLTLTFDGKPSQVSWKFENQRTSKVLAGVAFGEYDDEQMANQTIVVPLDILTSEDYDEDWMGSDPGVLRDYRFVIYDRGGNGLCCKDGDGSYELHSKETLIAQGDKYGAIDEQFFSINPKVFLGEDATSGVTAVNNVPTPTQPTPANNNLPVVNVPANNNNSPTPAINSPSQSTQNEPSPTPPTTPTAVAQTIPTLMQSFFCGTNFIDAENNCNLPCPTGSPAECANSNELTQDKEYVCYASTTCRERYSTPNPTLLPSGSPTPLPTKTPTPLPTPQPTKRQPTSPPTPLPTGKDPTRPPQDIPTTQQAIDSNTWFCGVDWDWITSHCDEAIPCPRGDAVDCPANQACFASTPCTLSPTLSPTNLPSSMPTDDPTPSPTKSPFSVADILYGSNDNDQGGESGGGNISGGNSGSGGGGMNQPAGQPSSSGTTSDDGSLASDVNDALQNYNSLQYHFFCGISWRHADETCDTFCPSGDKGDCPDGEECYANTRCDGRDTHSPTTSPAPTVKGAQGSAPNNAIGNTPASAGEVCTLCENMLLDPTIAISFQSRTSTCGNLNEMLAGQNILVGSATCNSMTDMYRNTCCYDFCQLCQSDLRSEYVVQQGGFEASCQEISNILTQKPKDDTICVDAQTQLGGECCYDQCALCGDQSTNGMSTEWYATVTFQGLTTTCLGLDYMLRAEQITDGSGRCSELQGQYMDTCCYSTNSCQLCRADDRLYDIDRSKTINVEQPSTPSRLTTTTCAGMNDSLARLDTNSQQCTDGKLAFFGQCCNLSNVINNGSAPATDSDGGGGGGGTPNVTPGGGTPTQPSPAQVRPNPSPVGAPNPSLPNGEASPPSTTNGIAPSPTLPTLDSASSNVTDGSEGPVNQTGSPSPTSPYDPNFSWEKDWDPQGSSDYRAASATLSSLMFIIGMSALLLFV